MKKALLLLFILASCQKRPDLFEKKLTADTNCWLYERPESIGVEYDTVFLPVAKFEIDNTYRSFLYKHRRLEPMLPPVDGEARNGGTWKHDSINGSFQIDERSFKIRRFRRDTIFLSDTAGATHLLVRRVVRHSFP